MCKSIEDFLKASGFVSEHPQLVDTPQRVTETWLEQLLDGYHLDPVEILSEHYPSSDDGLVVVRDIDCHGVCPHHLLPFIGQADIAYIPDQAIVGFSKLTALVQCFTHRLTLQETATHQIAQALITYLGAKGAACVIKAQHLCMALRHSHQRKSQIITSSFQGSLRQNVEIQKFLL
jgi:GTP cyclohydrolase I